MKNKIMAAGQTSRLLSLALAGIVLLAGAGCNCININVGAPQTGTPGSYPPPFPASAPPPSGGNFVPFQSTITGVTGTTTVCGKTVSKKHVEFYLPTQTPNPGENGFRGYLFNVATGQVIGNTDYVLQAIVDFNFECGTPVAGSTNDVFFRAVAGTPYKIAAHFKPTKVPAGNPPITLYGAWVVQ